MAFSPAPFWHQGSGLLESFTIAEPKLVHFLQRIEDGYRDVPYHNR